MCSIDYTMIPRFFSLCVTGIRIALSLVTGYVITECCSVSICHASVLGTPTLIYKANFD